MKPAVAKALAIGATLLAVALAALLLPACCCAGRYGRAPVPAPAAIPPIGTEPMPTPTEAEAHAPTEVQMRNVDFHIDPVAVLHIHALRGSMRAKEAGAPLNF